MAATPIHHLRTLPTFLIIGAGKSGTTSLWSYLNQHPQIGMSAIKEPSFFSIDEVHARGVGWYARLWTGHEDKLARGEASNSYSATETFPHTIDRIADVMPAPKFLYIVRHPRARSESDWMERSKVERISFSEFLRSDPVYADKNMYLRTLERYTDRFGEDSVMVLFYDDLRRDPNLLLASVCTFLGVDAGFAFETGTRHGQSAEARRFLPGIAGLRSTKLYADLSVSLPDGLKRRLRGVLSTTYKVTRPTWTEADAIWFRERFEAPSRAFLERLGQNPCRWEWQEGWS